MTDSQRKKRDSTRIALDPPTFSPPADMRRTYLGTRKSEIESMLESARNGEWKPVVTIANHVRGTGAMYGFANVGNAAEALVRAVQNGDAGSLGYLEDYAKMVSESYV